jgi:hypothetical protein
MRPPARITESRIRWGFTKPSLGKECSDCEVPIDPTNRRCTLCNRHYPKYLDFDKDRCEHCGSYNVYMDEFDMRFWCDDCQLWIESTNEGNGATFADCRECGGGFIKDQSEYPDICYWCG